MSTSKFHPVLIGGLWSLGFAVLWTTLAALNPTTNYHLSPLVAAIAAPAAVRMTRSGRLRWAGTIAVVGVGLIITIAAAIIINTTGRAQGPSFSPTVSPIAELIAVIVAGALIGAAIAIAPRGAKAGAQESAEFEETSSKSSSAEH